MIIKNDAASFDSYIKDASNYKGFCDKVLLPETVEDIVSIVKECSASKTPISIAGNGTGLNGGRVPEGGVVISMERMNKVFGFDAQSLTAEVEAGVMLADFLQATDLKNFFYPPDPTEKNCFIGATISTNASGARTFGYGSTRAFVKEIEVVLADEEIIHLRRGEIFAENNKLDFTSLSGKQYSLSLPEFTMPQVKNTAGYCISENVDAIDLFIGSEGTLGIITRAKLMLLKKPESVVSALAYFADEEQALAFTQTLRNYAKAKRDQSGALINPCAIEFFDNNSLIFLKPKYSSIPLGAHSAVWLEQNCLSAEYDQLLEMYGEALSDSNALDDIWFAFEHKDYERLSSFRHSISDMVNEYISKNGFRKLGTDAAVPEENFREFYFFNKELMKSNNMDYVFYGHIGNCHLHLNMLPKNENEFAKGKMLYREICQKAVELNGTVSAEHGIGKMKREYFYLMYSDEVIKGMAKIKSTLDPHNILNRGNIFYEEDLV